MKPILSYRPAWRQHLSLSPYPASSTSPFKHNRHLPNRHHVRLLSTPTHPLIYPEAPGNSEHHDLASYAAYAVRTGLDRTSKTYIGTHYEYAVASALATLGFELRRVGGRSDRGIDLLGTWGVPSSLPPSSDSTASTTSLLRVLLQCKASSAQSATKIGPQHVRELEGAFAGAPSGWRSSFPGSGVMALLVAPRPATKGVRDALGSSRRPLGYVCCSPEGRLEQMLWNRRAEEEGLEGVGVGVRFVKEEQKEEGGGDTGREEKQLILTWKGKPYVPGQLSANESV